MPDTSKDETHNLDELYSALEDVRGRLAQLVATDLLAELLPIWKRPGWTTPAEFFLVRGMFATISQQIEGLERTIEVVVKGSDAVAPR